MLVLGCVLCACTEPGVRYSNIKEVSDTTAYGVLGFRITVSGTTGKVPLRFRVESLAARPEDTALPFVEIEALGTYAVLFEDSPPRQRTPSTRGPKATWW